jgi:hypothetical protein
MTMRFEPSVFADRCPTGGTIEYAASYSAISSRPLGED